MSDDMKMALSDNPPADAGAKKGFLATPTGKVVAIIVGLGILGIIAGIAVAIVLYVFGNQAVDTTTTQNKQPAKSSAATTATVEPKTPADEVKNKDVFTFRDVFEPLVKKAASSADASGTVSPSAETSDSLTPMENGVLYLQNILDYGDGTTKGLFYYNGVEYQLGPGEGIPGTPWEVLRISSSGVVTMLYGDVQVTLAIGQGIRK